jgi:RNA polymerase sigma-70 factor, ECF subfamily
MLELGDSSLRSLPARQRAVLTLRDVLHWRTTEIAELLGTSERSVQQALRRARREVAAKD